MGAHHFDVEKFGCDWAYTVDGGDLGDLEYENFNAAGAKMHHQGRERAYRLCQGQDGERKPPGCGVPEHDS